MLYLYFHSIYLFHIIPSLCLTSGPFTGPQQIQTDHLILSEKLNLVLISKKKRTCHLVDFSIPADHSVKIKESKKIDKYLDLAGEMKKTVEHKSDGDTNSS